jgi:hypothetical protein
MQVKRTWVVASATIAIAGFAGAGIALASDDVELRDQRHAPVVQLQADEVVDGSAGSADSAADSPGESGYSGSGAIASVDSALDSPVTARRPCR